MEALVYSNPQARREINDWPYGQLRTTATFHIEADPKRGERAVRTMVNPKNGQTCAPKKLTYAHRARIVDGSDGRTYILEDNVSHFTVMQSNMKFQQETIFPNNPRYAAVAALFGPSIYVL
jgi:hypothetical protein